MNRIKELRKQKKMTQKQLAEKIFVDASAISFWENGVNLPSTEKQVMLADLFGVSLDYLLGRSETPVPETQAQNNTELAVLFNKLRKDPLAVEVTRFFLNLSPKKKEAAKTVLFTAFGE